MYIFQNSNFIKTYNKSVQLKSSTVNVPKIYIIILFAVTLSLLKIYVIFQGFSVMNCSQYSYVLKLLPSCILYNSWH